MSYVIPFKQIRIHDIGSVGGKNASLGEMINALANLGVRVPDGFATTTFAFRDFLKTSGLDERIVARLSTIDFGNIQELLVAGAEVREWIVSAPLSRAFESHVRAAMKSLDIGGWRVHLLFDLLYCGEDTPDASFAGQQESFLNVVGVESVLEKIREVFASLYNDRAISYRAHNGYAHAEVAMSVGVQHMVRADTGSAGVMFTLDTESGFKDVVFITSSYGLGETVVQGAVNPDEFHVFKPMLEQGYFPIVGRRIGSKLTKMEFDQEQSSTVGVRVVDVPISDQARYSLSDGEVIELARYAVIIEAHYGRPMDIEWARDGNDGKIYILQARPETVKSKHVVGEVQRRYRLKEMSRVLVSGRAVGQKIGSGPVRIISNASEMHLVKPGDVLVADMTDPNWEPVMKKASAIITNRGGRTCHAAIIARELGVPAVVGCGDATDRLENGQLVTVSCAEGDDGQVYEGVLGVEVIETNRGEMPAIDVDIMMNIGNPQLAYALSHLPNKGVGLARLEFIINNHIGIHPKAILDYPSIEGDVKDAIELASRGYASPRLFFIQKLKEGIATIAAAFWPKKVIVRLSDFKSNEYRKLIGGTWYEPEEENPMLGFRGVTRYLSPDFAECVSMECEALRWVRNEMGFTNVHLMVPFVRTLSQAENVVKLLATHGLERGKAGLNLIMMCELPANAILAEQFLQHFDGFSLGSNDMTQLTLGLDRDSGMELLTADFDERDEAVTFLLSRAINACLAADKYVGICGQGPSDHPEFARWLQKEGIQSMSLNPDAIVETWKLLAN